MKWEKKKINSAVSFERAHHASVFSDFRLFFIGGTDGKTLFSDIYFVELASMAYYSSMTGAEIDPAILDPGTDLG